MLAHEKRQPPKNASGKVTPGFESTQTDPHAPKDWQPFFERTIRAGIAGYRLVRVRSALRHSEPPECRYCGDRGSASLPLLRTAMACGSKQTGPSCEKIIKATSAGSRVICNIAYTGSELESGTIRVGRSRVSPRYRMPRHFRTALGADLR